MSKFQSRFKEANLLAKFEANLLAKFEANLLAKFEANLLAKLIEQKGTKVKKNKRSYKFLTEKCSKCS